MAAGIILKAKFLTASGKGYAGYINYIDRPEAITNALTIKNITDYDVFGTYTDYMGNPEKSTGLFNEKYDVLSAEGKEALKALFRQSQEKGGLLYQTLFSFESQWLKKNGLMDRQGKVMESQLREYTRQSVACLQKAEGMESWVWSAAVHYNTKHVHIHIALADPYPSWKEGQGRCKKNQKTGELYQRGKLKPKTLTKTKATFVNLAIRSKEENAKLNEIVRERIVLGKKLFLFSNREGGAIHTLFAKLLLELPEDRRLWNYNMAAMDPYRERIDELSRLFIDSYFPEEYADFRMRIDRLADAYQKSYGNSSWAGAFAEGKERDLYARLGNAILAECKAVRKEECSLRQETSSQWKQSPMSITWVNQIYYAIRGVLWEDTQSLKNQAAYERLREEQERTKT